jgi:ubiquinone/menaquinone biosynthesis C-methylase UbiE
VIITLGLCTIPDDRAAVGEAHRVLRPGGRLVLLEHVRSPSLAVRALQRVLDPLSVRFAADHLLRDPLDYLGGTGFEIVSVERLKWGFVERVIARKADQAGPAAAEPG